MRWVSELAYADFIGNELPNNEFFGEIVRDKLVYYPTVTREPFRNQGRITELLENGKLCQDIGIPQINPETDRAMICGSPHMLADISAMLDARGFTVSPGVGQPGDYVVERAFVDKAPRRSRRTACSPSKSPSHAMGFCWRGVYPTQAARPVRGAPGAAHAGASCSLGLDPRLLDDVSPFRRFRLLEAGQLFGRGAGGVGARRA